jgi:hypothetical protein
MVEMVCWSPEPDVYEARALDSHVRFRRSADGPNPRFTTDASSSPNPLADQDVSRFAPISEELGTPTPDRSQNSYPYAYEHIAQLFDHPCAPDLCVLHTSAHRCENHRGEHGSLGVVQARAPFIISGTGISGDGLVDRHCRSVDVAPTILSLLGMTPTTGMGESGLPRDDAYLSRQDGTVIEGLVGATSELPKRVIAFLLDGANPNMIYDMAGRGEAKTERRSATDQSPLFLR